MHHGTLGTGKHFNPREHQRHGRSRGRSGKNDQAGDPRHGEPVSAGQDTGGGFHRRPAHAGKENEEAGKDWMRKAETAVDKGQDDLARAALDRFQTSRKLAQSYREQVDDQKMQVETLKGALVKLE